MSASLRSAASIGVRQPATDHGQMAASEQRPVKQGHHSRLDLDGPGEHMERAAPTGGVERPSRRSATLGRRPTAHDRQTGLNLDGVDGHAEQEALTVSPGRPRGVVLSSRRTRPGSRPGARFGRWRGVAGLVVCVLALGVAACSVKDAKAEASVSASASASAAIARAEKGIADANASATASREAALTPELRAKRDAALAEPAPAKPSQMNEESPEGAVASVGYFLDLYRYAYMTGNTTEFAAMSDGQCIFCKSAIDNSTKLHAEGGWKDKWEQKFSDVSFHEKVEGNKYNRVDVTASHGQIVKHPGGSAPAVTDNETKEKTLTFAMCYVNGRWMVREVEVIEK